MRTAQAVMGDLAAAGLTAAQLALVMELSATVAAEARPITDAAAENKRAYDREYRRTHRPNRTTSYDSNDKHDPAPNERVILTPTHEEKPKPNGLVKKVERGIRLSADWQPQSLTGKAAAMVAAWQPGAMERELAKFKNYWLSKGANAARTDWQRTWVNWLISADEQKPRQSHERSKQASLSSVVHRLLVNGGIDGGAGEDAGLGSANVDERGAARALAARSG